MSFKLHKTGSSNAIILELPNGQNLNIDFKQREGRTILKMHTQDTDYDTINVFKKLHINSIELELGDCAKYEHV